MATLITDVHLYTGLDTTVRTNGWIYIGDDGRIADMGTGRAPSAPADCVRVDGGGAYAMPGLIDMHTHAMGGTAEESGRANRTSALVDQTIRGIANLGRALRHGITTIRDAGAASDGIFALRRAVEEGRIEGPRIISAGSALTMTGGHGSTSFAIEADGADGLRRAARLQLKAGAECIKLIASSGAAAPCGCLAGLQLNFVEMAAAADEARRGGYHSLAHAIPAAAVREALEAGVDSIEHGIFLDEETVRLMKEAGVHYTPTLAIFERIARAAKPGHYPDFMVEKGKQCVEPHRRSFRMAMEAGLPLLAGSDSGNWGWQLGDLADELVLMNRYGLPPERCLAAATTVAAAFLKKEADIGALQAGRYGDILLVGANPLEDLRALYDVRAVFKAGRQSA
jgi:imidazolonepropionase-like amidohydrolase